MGVGGSQYDVVVRLSTLGNDQLSANLKNVQGVAQTMAAALNSSDAGTKRLSATFREADKDGNKFSVTMRDLGTAHKKTAAATDELSGTLGKLGGALAGLWATAQLGNYAKTFASQGVELNAMLETSQLGIMATILTYRQYRDEQGHVIEGQAAMNRAFAEGGRVQQLLQAEAFNTTATLKDMVEAYQRLQMGASSQKATTEQITALVATLGNVATATGKPFQELSDQTSRVLMGVIRIQSPMVAILRSMGISNETIKSWIDQGIAVGKVQQALLEFLKIGPQINKTWTGVRSNVEDVVQQISGAALAPIMDSIKEIGLGFVSSMTTTYEENGRQITKLSEEAKVNARLVGEALRLSFEGVTDAVGRLFGIFKSGTSLREIFLEAAEAMAKFKSMAAETAEGLLLLGKHALMPLQAALGVQALSSGDLATAKEKFEWGQKLIVQDVDYTMGVKTRSAERARVLAEDLAKLRTAMMPGPGSPDFVGPMQPGGNGDPKNRPLDAAIAAAAQQFKDFRAVMEAKFDLSGLTGLNKAFAENDLQLAQNLKTIDSWQAKLEKMSSRQLALAGITDVKGAIAGLRGDAVLAAGLADAKALGDAERKYEDTYARIGQLASDSADDQIEASRRVKQQQLADLTEVLAANANTEEQMLAVIKLFNSEKAQIDAEAVMKRTQSLTDASAVLYDKLNAVTLDSYAKEQAGFQKSYGAEVKSINQKYGAHSEAAEKLIALAKKVFDTEMALSVREQDSIVGFRKHAEEAAAVLVLTTDSAAGGLKAGWDTIMSHVQSTTESVRDAVVGIWGSVTTGIQDGLLALETGTGKIGDVLKSLWDSVLKDFNKMLVQMLERWIATGELMGSSGGQGEGQGGFGGLFKAFGGGKTGTTAGTGGRTNYGEIDEWGNETPGTYTYGEGSGVGLTGYLGAAGAVAGIGMGIYSGIGALTAPAVTSRPTYQGQELGQTADFGHASQTGALLTGAAAAAIGAMLATTAAATAAITAVTTAGIAAAVPVVGWVVAAVLLVVAALLAIFSGPEEGHIKIQIADAFDKSGAKTVIGGFLNQIFDTTTNYVGQLAFKAAGPEGVAGYVASYRKELSKALGSATFDIAAGSPEDLQKDVQAFFDQVLPKLSLQAAFGQVGMGQPVGNRDMPGGFAGLDWNTNNGAMDAAGNFVKKQLYDPNAPIPLMLTGLGFTADKIGEIATKLSTTTDIKVFEKWLSDLVGVVVDLGDLALKFGRTRDQWYESIRGNAANQGTAGQFADQVANLKTGGELLSTIFGDDRVAAAKQLVTEGQQLLSNEQAALTAIVTFIDQIATQTASTIQAYQSKLLTPSENEAVLRARATADFGAIVTAANPKDVAAAWQKVLGDMTALLDIIVARIQAIKALQQDYADFRTQMATNAGPQFAMAPNAWLAQNQAAINAIDWTDPIAGAKTLLNLEKERYGNLFAMIQRIGTAITAVNDQVGAAVSALNLQAMGSVTTDAQGNKTWTPDIHAQGEAMWDQVHQLETQLKTTATPEAAQRIWNQITGLLGQLASQPQDPAHYAESRRILAKEWEDAGKIFDDRMGEVAHSLEEDLSHIGEQLKIGETALATALDAAQWDFARALHNLGLASDTATLALNGFADDLVTQMGALTTAIREWIALFTSPETPVITPVTHPGRGGGPRVPPEVPVAPPPAPAFVSPRAANVTVAAHVTVNQSGTDVDVEAILSELKPALTAAFKQNNVEVARVFRNNPSLLQRAS